MGEKVRITFIQKDKAKVEVDAEVGQTLLDVIKANSIDVIGACDGACACGTCHVYVDQETLKRIGDISSDKVSDDEKNVLDIVFNVQPNSRLACQMLITKDMDGAVITVPE